MIAAPVLWSSAGVVTRHIERAEPFEQVFWRSLFAFLFVFVVLLFQRTNPWKAVRAAGLPGLVSGLMWAIMFTAFLFALSLTTTANALVVMSVSPLLTALFASLFLKDPVPLRTWLAAGAAAVGIAWMFSAALPSALRRDGDRVPHPGGGGDQRRRPARERGEARPRSRRHARRRALLPDRPALRSAFFRDAERSRAARVPRRLPARRCPACCWCSRAARCSRRRSRCSACSRWCSARCGPGSAAGEEPGGATLLGGAIVLAALAANELAAMRMRPAAS